MSVAIEEMVHLLLVSNLAVALGGRPHLGRPNFPVAAGYFPAGVVVKLAPFSKSTLDHFIYLERPDDIKLADGKGFEPSAKYTRDGGYVGLMPSAQDYQTVGHLYEALSENLRASAERLGEKALFLGARSAQIGPDVCGMPGVREIFDLNSALVAISSIIEQGEGSPRHGEDSHYQRFMRVRAQYKATRAANKSFAPAWPVAISPVMRKPAKRGGMIYVDEPTAAKVLDFANAVYCLLLRCLTQAFGRPGGRADTLKADFLGLAIELMHVLAFVASDLATMPATQGKQVNAGMSFTMLRGNEPFFTGESEMQIFTERLAELASGARRLAHRSGFTMIERKLSSLGRRLNS